MTLPQLRKEIESCFHDKPHQKVLACVRDVKSWLDTSLREMPFHSFQHQFWLFCDRPNHVTWKYRKFSTDSWLPEAGQNQIELFDLDITGDNTIPRVTCKYNNHCKVAAKIRLFQAPGTPIIEGNDTAYEGQFIRTAYQGEAGSLICKSEGGNPVPTVAWYRNDSLVDDTIDPPAEPAEPNITRNTYSYTADIDYHLAVFECRVDNTVLQSYLSATIFLQVYKEPDQPTLNGPSTVISGTTYKWTCISRGGSPEPIITMKLSDIQFSTGIEQTSVQLSDNTFTVTVVLSWAPNFSTTNNNETLSCNVKHDQPRGDVVQNASLQLIVLPRIPVVTIPQSAYSETTGQSVTLQCTVFSPDTALQSVSWIFNNGVSTKRITQSSNATKYTGTTTTTPSLTIINLSSTDVGTYTCTATNTGGTGSSNAISLSVTGSKLPCRVLLPELLLRLTCSGVKVVNGVQTDVVINGSSRYSGGTLAAPSLTITNTQNTDEGTYVCYATNIVGTSNSQNTFLDVTGEIPTVQVSFPNYNVNYFSSITLICTVLSQPAALQVYWRKTLAGTTTNIDVINSGGKYSGSTISTPSLTVINAASSDEANYTCYATNSVELDRVYQSHYTLSAVSIDDCFCLHPFVHRI
ncbi:unnamed protein product [Mytilus edulis]|uniref:Ig-like domain-containing protein n=1 Tax=Mytilus edulis TaxID=6550 RepID=A0A8S3SNH4_MYTED|nr:unnamed protein product [Mytilus edulis]